MGAGGFARGLQPEPTPELLWQPPAGYTWADLPSESRLVQALAECDGARAVLEAKLNAQLAALDRSRPLRELARTQALAAVDPTSCLCTPATVREASDWMVANYARQQRRARRLLPLAEGEGRPTPKARLLILLQRLLREVQRASASRVRHRA